MLAIFAYQKDRLRRIAFIVGAILLSLAAIITAAPLFPSMQTPVIPSNKTMEFPLCSMIEMNIEKVFSDEYEQIQPTNYEGPFPCIDWAWAQHDNPDIIGWITIPGTSIDSVIVQERSDQRGYWLTHNSLRQYDQYGCPYLSADNSAEGLDSQWCTIFGHHIAEHTTLVLSELSNYRDPAFARQHQIALIQTPSWQRYLSVLCIHIVPKQQHSRRSNFVDNTDFTSWWIAHNESAYDRLSLQDSPPEHIYTLCSCLNESDNERILVTLG